MALVLGENTYITAADAAAYLAAYGPSGASVSETDLAQATLALDRLYYTRFVGVPTDPDQPLAFPRDGSLVIPPRIAHATVELALLLSDPDFAPYDAPTPAVVETSIEVDGISRRTKYATSDSVNRLYKLDLILAPYLRSEYSTGGITWATVVLA